ncbi:MAG: hypothetical protein N3G20_08890 [Verrucomicrobiae bacterium]|nr:hypothetical protein [Verrucomicrobiae bacterium]
MKKISDIQLTFFSPFGNRTYQVQTAEAPGGVAWQTQPQAVIRRREHGLSRRY